MSSPPPPTSSQPVGVRLATALRATSQSALKLAIDHTAAVGTDLIAVHTWHDDAADYESPAGLGFEPVIEAEHRVLAERLAGWQPRYPDVDIRRVIAHGPAADALLTHAATAELQVVGTTGRSGLDGLLHGSTSQSLLYRSPGPLAIVHPD